METIASILRNLGTSLDLDLIMLPSWQLVIGAAAVLILITLLVVLTRVAWQSLALCAQHLKDARAEAASAAAQWHARALEEQMKLDRLETERKKQRLVSKTTLARAETELREEQQRAREVTEKAELERNQQLAEKARLQSEIDARDATITSLRSQAAEAERACSSSVEKFELLDARYKQTLLDLDEISHEREQLEREIEARNHIIAHLSDHVADLQRAGERSEEALDMMRTAVAGAA